MTNQWVSKILSENTTPPQYYLLQMIAGAAGGNHPPQNKQKRTLWDAVIPQSTLRTVQYPVLKRAQLRPA